MGYPGRVIDRPHRRLGKPQVFSFSTKFALYGALQEFGQIEAGIKEGLRSLGIDASAEYVFGGVKKAGTEHLFYFQTFVYNLLVK